MLILKQTGRSDQLEVKLCLIGLLFLSLITSCAEEDSPLDITGQLISGTIVISTVATDPSTGPGLVSYFDSGGNLISILKDYFASGARFSTGTAFVPPSSVLMMVESTLDVADLVNLRTGQVSNSVLLSSFLSGAPVRQIAYSRSEDAVYVLETQSGNTGTIEKFILSSGQRLGNPFIATTTNTCVLANPYGIAFNENNQRLYVISAIGAAGRLSVFDTSGNCISHTTVAPLNAGTPSGITYHSYSNKLIVSFASSHAIYSMNLDGTGAAQIYLNSTLINVPRSISSDSSGYLYVSSSGTDTVEKLFYDGTGVATRALSGPLIGPGIYSQNVSSITVIP